LIEEVSNIIEDIIIIKKGNIIKNETCEELLSKGYTISGSANAVDAYSVGKEVLGTDTLGGLKTAYILGKAENDIPDNLEVTKLDLQKLFIQLTNS
jgi:ABC-2 type transport system ATP-binding protein